MYHRIRGRKLNRPTGHRKALFANQAISLIEHEQITTTLPKAKDLRPIVEKLITLGKRGDVHAKRQVISFLRNNVAAAEKVFGVLAKRYQNRKGGYLRIMKAGFRHGDNAPAAIIEFVDRDLQAKGKKDLERVASEKAAIEATQAS